MTTPFNIAFGGGVNQDSDQKLIQPPYLLDMSNVEFDRAGSVNRRAGHIAIPHTSGGIALVNEPPIRLGKFKDSLVMVTKQATYRYDPSADSWAQTGYMTPALADRTPIARNDGTSYSSGAMAYANGYEAHAWLGDDGFMRYNIFEATSRAPKLFDDATVFGNAQFAPRVVACGNFLVFFWINQNGGLYELRARTFDTTTQAISVEYVIAADASSAPFLDVSALSSTEMIVAYRTSVPTIKVYRIGPAIIGATSGPLTIGEDPIDCLAMCGTTGENAYVAWGNSTLPDSLRAVVIDPAALTVTAGPFTVRAGSTNYFSAGLVRASSTSALLVVENLTGAVRPDIRVREIRNDGSLVGPESVYSGWSLQSKPFMHDGSAYCWVGHDSQLQGTSFLLRLSPTTVAGQTIGWLAPRESGVIRARSHVPDVVQVATGQFRTSATIKTRVLRDVSNAYLIGTTGIDVFDVDFCDTLDRDKRAILAEASESLWIAGAKPGFYDGRFFQEASFLFGPEFTDATIADVAGGGALSAGTYEVLAIYEEQDMRGNIVSSNPISPPLKQVVGANDRLSVAIPQPPLSSRPQQSKVLIRLYRTDVNSPGPFHRWLSSVASPGGSGTVAFLDGTADTAIDTNESIYTDGSVLENVLPPPSQTVAIVQNRVFLASGKTVWYSKAFTPGETPGFNEQLTFRVEDGGDIVAVENLDDKPMVFKASSIYLVDGEGFGDTGNGSNYSTRIVSNDIGCVDVRSIVSTQDGIFFKGPAGIYMLDKGAGLQFIGLPVRDLVRDQFPIVTSATLWAAHQKIIWTLTDGIMGRAVVYDYRRRQWAVWHLENGAIVTCATVVKDVFYYGTANGVRRADPDTWQDAAVPYTASARTAWINLGGIQGYQAVKRATLLFDKLGDHDLSVTVFADYESFVLTEAYTWTAAELLALPREEVSIHLRNQKCSAIAFEVSDGAGNGAGFRLTSVRLEADVKRGSSRMRLQQEARK